MTVWDSHAVPPPERPWTTVQMFGVWGDSLQISTPVPTSPHEERDSGGRTYTLGEGDAEGTFSTVGDTRCRVSTLLRPGPVTAYTETFHSSSPGLLVSSSAAATPTRTHRDVPV